jgi:hypothetical protein
METVRYVADIIAPVVRRRDAGQLIVFCELRARLRGLDPLPRLCLQLGSNCCRRSGVITPRPRHWSQGLVRKGKRLWTVPRPSQFGQA